MDHFPSLSLTPQAGSVALAEWRLATSALFDSEPLEAPFHSAITTYSLGEILFGRSSSGPQRFVRDARVISRSGVDHLLVQFYIEGGFVGTADPWGCDVDPGDIVLFDLARGFETIASAFTNLNLIIPRRLLGPELRDRSFHGTVLRAGSTYREILSAHLKSLETVCQRADTGDAEDIVEATLGLVSVILRGIAADRSPAATADTQLRTAICAYIADNLEVQELGIEHLCERFGVSRSALYRMFVSLGGVSTFVRNRRLEAAFDELSRLDRRTVRLDILARKWGFTGQDSFSRAFKARYGFRPSRLRTERARALRERSGWERSDGQGLSNWIRTLGFPSGFARTTTIDGVTVASASEAAAE